MIADPKLQPDLIKRHIPPKKNACNVMKLKQ